MIGRGLSKVTATSLTLGFAFLYLPILLLVIYSFNASRLVTVWGGFSLQWYGQMLRNQQLLDAAWVTLRVALVASTLALVLGTMAEVLVAGELRLRRRDDAEIVLGVLQIGLGQDRVAGGLGIARQLNVFFSDMGGGSANLHVGAVRLIAPAQRVRTLAAA